MFNKPFSFLAIRQGTRWLGSVLAALLIQPLLAAPACADQAAGHFAAHYTRPALQHFHEQAQILTASLTAVCGPDAAEAVTTLGQPFKNVLIAWSALVPLRFGPLVEQNRFEKLYFWPDPRGLTQRQSGPFITGNTPLDTASPLSGYSVALQGLPALEQALYGTNGLLVTETYKTSACRYAQAVSALITARAKELQHAWTNDQENTFGYLFTHPGRENPLFRSQQEVHNELMKALTGGLQFLNTMELRPMQGSTHDSALPRRGPFNRSNNTFTFLKARTDALQNLYQQAGFNVPESAHWAEAAFLSELKRAGHTLDELETLTRNQAPVTPEQAVQFNRLITLVSHQLGNAHAILAGDIAPAAGITLGFNALDGD